MKQSKHTNMDESYLEVLELAENGNPVAMEAVGRAYLMDDTEMINRADAETLLQRGVDLGHGAAMYLRASLYASDYYAGQTEDWGSTGEPLMSGAVKAAYPEALLAEWMITHGGGDPICHASIGERLFNLDRPYPLHRLVMERANCLVDIAEIKTSKHLAEMDRLREALAAANRECSEARSSRDTEARSAKKIVSSLREETTDLMNRLAAASASALEARANDAEAEAERARSEAKKAQGVARKAMTDARNQAEEQVAAAESDREAMRREANGIRARESDMMRRIDYLEKKLRRNGIPFNEVMGHGNSSTRKCAKQRAN